MGSLISKFNTSKHDNLEVLNICLDTPNITKRRPRKQPVATQDALNPPFIHSATFIVSDETKRGCGAPFTIAKNAGIDFTPQYPGV